MNKLRIAVLVMAILLTILIVIWISPEAASLQDTSKDTSGQPYLRQVNTLPAPQVPKTTQTPLKTQYMKRTEVLDEGLVKDYAYRRVCEVFGCNQWTYFHTLIMKESGWNWTAQNPTSTAYGLMQFLNSTWSGTGYTKTSNPYQQLEAGFIYIQNRYGTPYNALQFHYSHNWY